MLNGDLKSLCSLWAVLARNLRYGPYIEENDIRTVCSRVAEEGLTFFTVTLPLLGKSLDRFHATQVWKCPEGFKTQSLATPIKFRGDPSSVFYGAVEIPVFLSKAIEAALEGDSVAVDCVRQLSYVFYKLEVGYDEETVGKFLDQFKKTDSEITLKLHMPVSFTHELVACMKRIIGRILCNADPLDIRPCHSSGATACRTENWEKYHKIRYFPALDEVFSYSEYFFYNPSHLLDWMDQLEEAPHADPRARVVLVPKDSRGPRVISCEPAELMYIQQGLMRLLYKTIESHPITSGLINFRDQTVNQGLSRQSSIDDSLATLDLSDASDRVSLDLVERVFPEPWVRALKACRSEETLLPDGTIVKLNKFAPMGSACCFPVEALVFWACAQATLRILERTSSFFPVYVYGDDIITPSHLAEDVIRGLEAIGLLVNRDKCYVKGPFRESCGGDFHMGYDVTPVKQRRFLGSSGTMLTTGADLCNNFIAKFGYDEAIPLIQIIEEASVALISNPMSTETEQKVAYSFPRTLNDLPGTLRTSPRACNDVFLRRRWNVSLQRYEYRILQLSNKALKRQPPNWGELLRKELSRGFVMEQPEPYSNPLTYEDAKLDPGEYTDTHSARNKWAWVWLG